MLLRYPLQTPAHASFTRPPDEEDVLNNVRLLAGAAPEYSALKKFMSIGQTWECFLSFMEEYVDHINTAKADDTGRPWVFFSTRYFTAKYGLNDASSRRNIAMFALFGLILKASSNAYTAGNYPAFMADGFERHKHEDQFGVMWYHVPTYTASMLTEADKLAERWNKSGYPRKSISKATLINLYGFALADRAYGNNGVRISNERKQAERAIEDVVLYAIQRDGYVYPAAIDAVLDDYSKSIWPSLRRDLCDRYDWRYSRPTPEEKRRFHLTGNKWIIRPP